MLVAAKVFLGGERVTRHPSKASRRGIDRSGMRALYEWLTIHPQMPDSGKRTIPAEVGEGVQLRKIERGGD